MRCIIADDEPLARKGIENFIKNVPFLALVSSCADALQLADILAGETADLLFLDIQMPKMTGMDFLRNKTNLPITIITSAYTSYAVESYELNVLDYLLKPISFERFFKAVSKAKDYFELQQNNHPGSDAAFPYFFLKSNNKYEKILYADIVFVEALQNYVVVHTGSQKLISYMTLKSMEDQLPKDSFLKINKSYIVSLHHIKSIDGNTLSTGNHTLPIGRVYKEGIRTMILKDKILKR